MTTNLRTEKFLAAVLPTVGLAWATRQQPPLPQRDTIREIVVEPTADGWMISAADALALAWASHR